MSYTMPSPFPGMILNQNQVDKTGGGGGPLVSGGLILPKEPIYDPTNSTTTVTQSDGKKCAQLSDVVRLMDAIQMKCRAAGYDEAQQRKLVEEVLRQLNIKTGPAAETTGPAKPATTAPGPAAADPKPPPPVAPSPSSVRFVQVGGGMFVHTPSLHAMMKRAMPNVGEKTRRALTAVLADSRAIRTNPLEFRFYKNDTRYSMSMRGTVPLATLGDGVTTDDKNMFTPVNLWKLDGKYGKYVLQPKTYAPLKVHEAKKGTNAMAGPVDQVTSLKVWPKPPKKKTTPPPSKTTPPPSKTTPPTTKTTKTTKTILKKTEGFDDFEGFAGLATGSRYTAWGEVIA